MHMNIDIIYNVDRYDIILVCSCWNSKDRNMYIYTAVVRLSLFLSSFN